MFRRWCLFAIFFLLPLAAVAQDTSTPLTIYTSGMIDVDGSVIYSIFVASAVDDNDLTITSAVPAGAVFVESFWQPEGAAFNGENEGTLSWSLPAVASDTLIGPFSFRVHLPADADIPYDVPATVTTTAGNGRSCSINRPVAYTTCYHR